MPYVDEKTFEDIKSAYEKIDFSSEFMPYDKEVHEEYRQRFWYLLQNEVSFWNIGTGEELYIEDWLGSSGQWFFRITDEQFKELEKPYIEAYDLAVRKLWETMYTYEELFGEFSLTQRKVY